MRPSPATCFEWSQSAHKLSCFFLCCMQCLITHIQALRRAWSSNQDLPLRTQVHQNTYSLPMWAFRKLSASWPRSCVTLHGHLNFYSLTGLWMSFLCTFDWIIFCHRYWLCDRIGQGIFTVLLNLYFLKSLYFLTYMHFLSIMDSIYHKTHSHKTKVSLPLTVDLLSNRNTW